MFQSLKSLMLSALIIFFIIYLLIATFAYFGSDALIFQPQRLPFRDDASIIKLTTPNGQKISAKFFRNEKAEFTLLSSHGNAENIFDLTPFYEELRKAGFNVLAYDYRGYGTSEGKPGERNTYEDIETAYNYLVEEQKISPGKIIIHGRSLGGAIAIDLASRKSCGGLIVESSFISAFRFLTPFPIFPFDKFDSIHKIDRVKCPILFIHGTRDTLIPFWHTEKLFQTAREPKFIYPVENADHNDVFMVAGKRYLEEILNFSNRLKG